VLHELERAGASAQLLEELERMGPDKLHDMAQELGLLPREPDVAPASPAQPSDPPAPLKRDLERRLLAQYNTVASIATADLVQQGLRQPILADVTVTLTNAITHEMVEVPVSHVVLGSKARIVLSLVTGDDHPLAALTKEQRTALRWIAEGQEVTATVERGPINDVGIDPHVKVYVGRSGANGRFSVQAHSLAELFTRDSPSAAPPPIPEGQN
jgi:hypothetical protein